MMLISNMVYLKIILWHIGLVTLTSRVIGGKKNFARKFIRYSDNFDELQTLKD